MIKLDEKPAAYALISGSEKYPELKGRVDFYDTFGGTVVAAAVHGITDAQGKASQSFHGFHVHGGKVCTGTEKEPYANADGHYNPQNTMHPDHAGDLPALLSCDGSAWMMVYTNRFYPEEVIGKTVILHGKPDDFHTQPSGNSGEMIACGQIVPWETQEK